jgi:hypothetical protein
MRPRFDSVQLSGNISALFSIIDMLDRYIVKRAELVAVSPHDWNGKLAPMQSGKPRLNVALHVTGDITDQIR